MKKIVIASDSHGSADALRRILRAEPDAHSFIFLGDGYRDLEGLQEEFPAVRFYWVLGNCDWSEQGLAEGLLPLEGLLFFYTHGHEYHVKSSLLSLTYAAQSKGADVALFGHTHQPVQDSMNGVILFNPGSVGRDFRGHPSYGVALCDQGKVQLEHKEVPPIWAADNDAENR